MKHQHFLHLVLRNNFWFLLSQSKLLELMNDHLKKHCFKLHRDRNVMSLRRCRNMENMKKKKRLCTTSTAFCLFVCFACVYTSMKMTSRHSWKVFWNLKISTLKDLWNLDSKIKYVQDLLFYKSLTAHKQSHGIFNVWHLNTRHNINYVRQTEQLPKRKKMNFMLLALQWWDDDITSQQNN